MISMDTDRVGFPDPNATIAPLLAVADLNRALEFWVTRVGGEAQLQWETYALVAVGEGQLHLAVTGDPPPDRPVRLVPPSLDREKASGEVVIKVSNCRTVVATLEERGVQFLGPPSEPAWGGEVRAFALDPDNHLLEITSSA